jgi:RNase P subunit RPR2
MSSEDGVCPTCGGPWDPVADLATMNAHYDAFTKAYPRIHCANCHKRLSAAFDSIDAPDDGPIVTMDCRHCGHRFEVPRQREVSLGSER